MKTVKMKNYLSLGVIFLLVAFVLEGLMANPPDPVCVVKNKKGDIIFSCSPMENESCSKTYLGNTLTCVNAREDELGS